MILHLMVVILEEWTFWKKELVLWIDFSYELLYNLHHHGSLHAETCAACLSVWKWV